jgi:transposase
VWTESVGPFLPSNWREVTEMRRHEISDADWDRVKGLLPTRGPNPADRGFVNAVLYVAKTGVPWRDLPDRFGNWNSVWRRFRRWAGGGVWGRVLAAVRDPDVSTLVLDSTVVRAHPHAAGALKKTAPRLSAGAAGGSGRRPTRA